MFELTVREFVGLAKRYPCDIVLPNRWFGRPWDGAFRFTEFERSGEGVTFNDEQGFSLTIKGLVAIEAYCENVRLRGRHISLRNTLNQEVVALSDSFIDCAFAAPFIVQNARHVGRGLFSRVRRGGMDLRNASPDYLYLSRTGASPFFFTTQLILSGYVDDVDYGRLCVARVFPSLYLLSRRCESEAIALSTSDDGSISDVAEFPLTVRAYALVNHECASGRDAVGRYVDLGMVSVYRSYEDAVHFA